MSPPQFSAKPSTGEYGYKPRSQTPDRAAGSSIGGRPHRSSSGTMTQRPGPFYEPIPRSTPSQHNINPFHEPKYTPPLGPAPGPKDEFDERARRTSIGGLLQRSESQPQPNNMSPGFPPTSHALSRPESIQPSLAPLERSGQQPMNGHDPPRLNGLAGAYDTRPPGFSGLSRFPQPTPQQMSAPLERSAAQSQSPEFRRSHLNGNEGRLAGILNQQGDFAFGAQNMARQDSMQSQSDRSVLGDRLRTNRAYSPFAGSVASGPLDDQVRKGSEELSQHRAILALANESKRGRYSPVPQAVQGAQAQTPAPDAGIKTEHGRVFAGIGSGLGSASAGPTPTPQPLPASPFKRDEGGARLSEENLMKMSRSTSGINKRNRKTLDEDNRAASDVGGVKKSGPGRGKRSKYAHSYKLDLEDAPLGQRKNGTLPTSNPARRAATPMSNPTQLHQTSQPQPPSLAVDRPPVFKPKKTIRISSVVAQAQRNPRRHLGFYKYDPLIGPVDHLQAHSERSDVSIRPNLPPSFQDPDQINCTYTIKVSSVWLKQQQRHVIGREQCLWGSGIYTDDSDPVSAAMHSGFIASALPNDAVLDRLIEEQNPKIEGLVAPKRPAPVPEGKDLQITLVVLPQLESYVDSVRFGIKSRAWPSLGTWSQDSTIATAHDGVSFMVLKTEFVEDGVMNRRLGRTGAERRKRLQQEMADRKRSFEIRDQKIAQAEARARESKAKMQQKKPTRLIGLLDKLGRQSMRNTAPDEAGEKANNVPTSNIVGKQSESSNKAGDRTGAMLDGVGQRPDSWIKQLNDASVTATA